MRTFHLACLPMPSPQGTQGLLRVLTESLADAGHDTHLLTYAHGDGPPLRGVHHHRAPGPRRGSSRSGPSLRKVLLDGVMLGSVRRHARALGVDRVLAHNVEAALVARAAGVRATYVAHTRMDAELPTYVPERSWRRRALRPVGATLDALCLAHPSVAIAPDLARHLGVRCVLPPWPTPAPFRADERLEARRELPEPDAAVVLYAGNLDGYQGWTDVAAALTGQDDLTWLVATESDPAPLAGHRHVRWRLRDDSDRRRAHAAADVVVVPRRAPGGLPIKLLDALARDVPVVAPRRALAGLNPDGVYEVADDDPDALREGIRRAVETPPRGGRAWVECELAPTRRLPAWLELTR